MQEKITCPKCGFEQQESTECLRCGIVFAKFDPHRHTPVYSSPPTERHSEHSETAELLDTADRWIYPVRKKTPPFSPRRIRRV